MGSVCTDGTPAMIGHRSVFLALMKLVAPHVVSNHYCNEFVEQRPLG